MANPHGTPIWYELVTPDPDAAKAFYEAVVGWSIEARPAGEMDYRMITASDGTNVAGLARQADGYGPEGMAPGWRFYVGVADVDATVAKILAGGGAVAIPAFDFPGVGRMALVADPQGIAFFVMAPPPEMRGETSTSFSPTLPQRCGWNELVTTEQVAALAFYTDIFGWTSNEAMSMGEMGDYTFIDRGDVRLGAMMNGAPGQPTRWSFYFAIADVDAAVETITAEGGTVVMGPVDVPGGQRIVVALDPHGAQVGFVSGQRP